MGQNLHADPLIGRRRAIAVVALLLAVPGVAKAARASTPQVLAAQATPGRIPQTFTVASDSMIPTIDNGDVVSAIKLTGPPRRGDVILFNVIGMYRPWARRVIGLPGDTVQMKTGRVYLNGVVVPQEPIAKVRTKDVYGKPTDEPTFRETLPGGVSYTVIMLDDDRSGPNNNSEYLKTPPDMYFVIGDNRNISTDSRVIGTGWVAATDIIGRADFIIGSTASKDRAMMPIH